jgi:Aminoglycoside-2''-adenylyltransferase
MHPDDAEWEPWRPEQAADLLAGIDVPWAVAAGWAIDLFLGRERREHEDLELAVPEARFAELAGRFPMLRFFAVGPGLAASVDEEPERLADTHQTWALDRESGVWRLDVFREPSEDGRWVCRRNDRIRLPYGEVIESNADGIPYVRPEVVLLFKAKGARPKDESDLAAVLPRLDVERRELLANWLELVHPGHFWHPDVLRGRVG